MVRVTDAIAGAIERLARDQETGVATRKPLFEFTLKRFRKSHAARSANG